MVTQTLVVIKAFLPAAFNNRVDCFIIFNKKDSYLPHTIHCLSQLISILRCYTFTISPELRLTSNI